MRRCKGRAVLQVDRHRADHDARAAPFAGADDVREIALEVVIHAFHPRIVRADLLIEEHRHATPNRIVAGSFLNPTRRRIEQLPGARRLQSQTGPDQRQRGRLRGSMHGAVPHAVGSQRQRRGLREQTAAAILGPQRDAVEARALQRRQAVVQREARIEHRPV